MHEFDVLRDLLILVAFAIPAVAVTERMKVPSIVAFLATGVVIGPFGLGLISGPESVQALAELGVVLLLFEIGLEVSLARVIRMGSVVFVGGGAQVVTTMLVVTGIGLVASIPVNRAVMFGALIALSSTAIVLKTYRDRDELDTPHGRVVLGILLFQDLAIAPLILIVPILAQTGSTGVLESVVRVGGGVVILAGLIGGGRFLVPWVLERVVGLRNREVFTLTVAFFGLGAAYVTAGLGLSLALGAFIAGLIISESEYGVQALSDVLPFRALFSGIFFISVGMLLDLGYVMQRPLTLLGLALAVIAGKMIIASAVVRFALRRSVFTSSLSGLGVAQVGEFSFVLAGVAAPAGLLDENTYQGFLAASVLSMVVAPFLIMAARPLAEWIAHRAGRDALEVHTQERPAVAALNDHAIIVGYGLGGRYLARVLRSANVPYLILELNGQTVRRARLDREPVFFGDGTRREVLDHAGVRRARVVIFSISSPTDERRGVQAARELNPEVTVLVRTRYIGALADLEALGASDVVVEEFEAALELFERVLQHYHIPVNTIERELAAVRSEQYGVLRGTGGTQLPLDRLKHMAIHHALTLVEIEQHAEAVGQNPSTMDLRKRTGVTVVAAVRHGVALYAPDPEFRFQSGDAVVLVGDAPNLAAATNLFRNPPAAGDL